MNTNDAKLYNLINVGLGGDSWQEYIDRYEEIYDDFHLDGFEFAPMNLGYTWQQLLGSTGAVALPAYVDPESPGYEAALREVSGLTGNIPTMKKYYRLNRTILRQQLLLQQQLGKAAITDQFKGVMLGLLDESTDGLIKGYQNALCNQRDQIVSTGKFTISSTNNPRGLQGITISFGVPAVDTTTCTSTNNKLWWTTEAHTTEGSASDPIDMMRTAVKKIRREEHYTGPLRLEMPDVIWQDLLGHSKVKETLAYSILPLAPLDKGAKTNLLNYSDEMLLAKLASLIRIDKIVIRDTKAVIEKVNTTTKDIEQDTIDNFDEHNITFLPDGEIGTIQGVQPLSLGYDSDKAAYYDSGRLLLAQRAEAATHSIYIESEASQICVPSPPKHIYIYTVVGTA